MRRVTGFTPVYQSVFISSEQPIDGNRMVVLVTYIGKGKASPLELRGHVTRLNSHKVQPTSRDLCDTSKSGELA